MTGVADGPKEQVESVEYRFVVKTDVGEWIIFEKKWDKGSFWSIKINKTMGTLGLVFQIGIQRYTDGVTVAISFRVCEM